MDSEIVMQLPGDAPDGFAQGAIKGSLWSRVTLDRLMMLGASLVLLGTILENKPSVYVGVALVYVKLPIFILGLLAGPVSNALPVVNEWCLRLRYRTGLITPSSPPDMSSPDMSTMPEDYV